MLFTNMHVSVFVNVFTNVFVFKDQQKPFLFCKEAEAHLVVYLKCCMFCSHF